MSWTAPRTWVAGETVTAALMNTHVRDNLNAIGGPWTAYTPTFTWTSSSFTFTTSGRWMAAGKLIHFWAKAAISGGTYGSGTGSPTITLPVSASSADSLYGLRAYLLDSGTAWYTAASLYSSVTAVGVSYLGTNNVHTAPTSTLPFTWATSDAFLVAGTYESA